jgi:hypothetical protein
MKDEEKYSYFDVRHSHSSAGGHLLDEDVELGLQILGCWSTIRSKLRVPASPIKLVD